MQIPKYEQYDYFEYFLNLQTKKHKIQKGGR